MLAYDSSEGFRAKLINQSTLELELPLIKHKAILLAPTSTHSTVHSTSVQYYILNLLISVMH